MMTDIRFGRILLNSSKYKKYFRPKLWTTQNTHVCSVTFFLKIMW